MRPRRKWKLGPLTIAGVACATTLVAQAAGAQTGKASDVCSLATSTEFQEAHGVDPRLGILPDDPTPTVMTWGPHCDYANGAVDLFTTKSPTEELERVLGLTKAVKQRVPVQGLGQRAFFTVVYPEDQYRRRGFLAVYLGPRILGLSMDPRGDEAPEATQPRLEALAKLVLPRVK